MWKKNTQTNKQVYTNSDTLKLKTVSESFSSCLKNFGPMGFFWLQWKIVSSPSIKNSEKKTLTCWRSDHIGLVAQAIGSNKSEELTGLTPLVRKLSFTYQIVMRMHFQIAWPKIVHWIQMNKETADKSVCERGKNAKNKTLRID